MTLQTQTYNHTAIQPEIPMPASILYFPSSLRKLILKGRGSLKPPEDITVSQWAEKYRQLPATAKMSGLWKNYMIPYGVEIQDAFSDPKVEEITWMKSGQVGGTEIMNNMIGYTIDIDPMPIAIMQPTVDMAKKYSKEKLEPMIEDSKRLRDKVSKRKAKDSDNLTLHKRFVGGFVVLVGANSPHALRQLSVGFTGADDIDSNEMERGEKGIKEGDPVRRLEYRTKTYRGKRKKVRISTPTDKGFSRIENLYNLSSKKKYWVPCPDCKKFQILVFEQLKWEKEKDLFGKTSKHDTETVYYECVHCKEKIYEKDKIDLVNKGEWRAEKPEIISHQGFWINELYSFFSSWREIVDMFLAAKGDREALQVFYNLTLGLPFERYDIEQVPEIDELMKRREDYLTKEKPYMPNGVLIICCSVDVQADRLEVAVKGWGIGYESWLLNYHQIYGNTTFDDIWDELDRFRETIWQREDGLKMGIALTTIDTGGDNTQRVYDYCRERQYSGVLAVKGRAVMARPVLLNRSNVSKSLDVILQNINTISAKDTIIMRLKNSAKSGYKVMHFTTAFCGEDYFKGLVKSEKRIKKIKPGVGIRIEWIHDRKIPNEPLDLEVYNLTAILTLMPNFEKTKERFDIELEEMKNAKEIKTEQTGVITTGSGRQRRTTSRRRN